MSKSITQLNPMSREEFVNVLGTVFEHTPQIAQKAWNYRPFVDATQLHQKMYELSSAVMAFKPLLTVVDTIIFDSLRRFTDGPSRHDWKPSARNFTFLSLHL